MEVYEILTAIKNARDAGDLDAEYAALEAYKAIAKEQAPYQPTMVDRARAVGQGALYSAADELEAGVRAPFSEQTYPEILKDIRGKNAAYHKTSPWEAHALEFAGGAGTGGAEYAALSQVPKFAALSRPAQLAVSSGLGGLAAGIGAGTDLMTRTIGGALGGVAGTFGGWLGSKAEGLYKGTAQQQAAEKQLNRQDLAAEVAKLNDGSAVHWATGVDVDPMLAKAAMDARPDNLEAFTKRYKDRQRLQFPLVEDTLKGLGESPQSRAEALAELMQQRKEAAEALYAPMEGALVTRTPKLMATLQTEEGQDAANRTLKALRERNQNPNLTLEQAADSFDFWHGFQQVLRDKAERYGISDKPLSGLEASAMGEKRDRVMASMFGESWGPKYKEATDQYRGDSEVIDALKDSEKFIKLDRGVFSAAVDKMNEQQRTAFASGIVSDIVEKAARSPDTANMARNILKTPAMRYKMESLLGQERYDAVEKQLNGLATMTETYGKLFANSNTAEKLTMKEILAGGQQGDGVLASIASLDPRGALRAVIPRSLPVLHPRTAEGILNVLGGQSPQEISAAMAELRKAARPSKATIPTFLGGVRGAGAGYFQ